MSAFNFQDLSCKSHLIFSAKHLAEQLGAVTLCLAVSPVRVGQRDCAAWLQSRMLGALEPALAVEAAVGAASQLQGIAGRSERDEDVEAPQAVDEKVEVASSRWRTIFPLLLVFVRAAGRLATCRRGNSVLVSLPHLHGASASDLLARHSRVRIL